jgi:hypothetical protein
LLLHVVRDTVTAKRDSSVDLAGKYCGHVRDFRDAVSDAPAVEDYCMRNHSTHCEFCSKYPGSLFTNLQQMSPHAVINAANNARMHARCVDWNDLAFVCSAVALGEGGPKTQTVPGTCIRDKRRLRHRTSKQYNNRRRREHKVSFNER